MIRYLAALLLVLVCSLEWGCAPNCVAPDDGADYCYTARGECRGYECPYPVRVR